MISGVVLFREGLEAVFFKKNLEIDKRVLRLSSFREELFFSFFFFPSTLMKAMWGGFGFVGA